MSERSGKHGLRMWGPEEIHAWMGGPKEFPLLGTRSSGGPVLPVKRNSKAALGCDLSIEFCFWDGRGMESAVQPGPGHEGTGFMLASPSVTKG